MDGWNRTASALGTRRLVVGLGGLYVAGAVAVAIQLLAANAGSAEVAGRCTLIGAPGAVLLYGGFRLPDMDFHPDAHPRIVAWTLGGLALMLAVLGTVDLASPGGIDRPSFSTLLATALGSMGGFGAGIHDARARSRELELEETVERLRTANRRLEEFAYAASHDLQEPLRMVSSYLRLLENRYGDDLDDDAAEYIDFAVDGADRMRAMVEGLLEYSRVSTRGKPLETTDAGAVLETTLDDLRLRIEETDARITADELPTVTADPDQLALVFRHLLSNAIAYSGDAPPRVQVSAERTDDAWRFSVVDEGIGIDPEYHEQIFREFEQLRTGEDDPASTAGGIGLALCERIVERHRGEIWVDSAPGEGTAVHFTIPVTRERRSGTPARSPSAG